MFEPPQSQSCRVVVVEDHVEAAYTLEHVFRLHGLDVRVAHDGIGGLVAIREHKPHIVYSDIELPDISGFELARRVRREFAHSLTLVSVSGLGGSDVTAASHAAGFDAHFAKPANPFALIALAREALARSATPDRSESA